jgi:hypothetical protein
MHQHSAAFPATALPGMRLQTELLLLETCFLLPCTALARADGHSLRQLCYGSKPSKLTAVTEDLERLRPRSRTYGTAAL